MGKSSAQPSHTPDINVCPFLGRESEEDNGAPTPLNLPREGGDDLRPSPVFRCLATAEPTRVDAGRQRRLCLSARHSSCRRFGDAESRQAQAPATATAPISPSAAAEESETDARIGRIRRRFRGQDEKNEGPRARVTVAGQPVDFTPMAASAGESPSAEAPEETDGPTADRLGALWDDQVEWDRLGSSQDADQADESAEPVYRPPISAGPPSGAGQNAGAALDAAESAARFEDKDEDEDEDEDSNGLGGDAEVDTGVDAGWAADADDDTTTPFERDFDSGAVDDGAVDDGAVDDGAVDDGEVELDMDAEDPLGPAPTVQPRRPQPESERRPLATAVSGALGGLGAAGGGDHRSRLMGIAGVLLIVVGIITAVLAVVVGLNKSGETTVPIAAADADPVAEAGVESESAVTAVIVGDEAPADTAAATPAAEAPEAPEAEAAVGEAVAAQPAVVAASPESGEATAPATDGAQAETPAEADSVAEAAPVPPVEPVEPTATVEEAVTPEAEAPAAETPSDEVAIEPASPETPVAEEPPASETLNFVVPEGPAPDYGWVSYWPQTQVYTVAQGDTITSLAEQFDTHAYAIICLNTQYWFDSARLFTMYRGDALVIPTGYTIPGDDQTLYQYLLTGFLLRRCG